MREKRRAQFLKDVAEAARQRRRKPRGRPSPQNMTEEGRRLGLEAIRNAPRCRSVRRNGERCKNPAMKGATRCLKHGGRVEVPAHPHNIRRFFSGITVSEKDSYQRSREAWDQMTYREQREFLAMLPAGIAKKSKLVFYAASVWKQIEKDDFVAWSRLLEDLRSRMIGPEWRGRQRDP
jgi:hypothetical protein